MLVCIVCVCSFPREAKRVFRFPETGGSRQLGAPVWDLWNASLCALTVEPVLEICFFKKNFGKPQYKFITSEWSY